MGGWGINHTPPQLARAHAARRLFQKLGSQTAAYTQHPNWSYPPHSPSAVRGQDNQQDQDNSQPTPKRSPLLHGAPTSPRIAFLGTERLKLVGSKVRASPREWLCLSMDLQRDTQQGPAENPVSPESGCQGTPLPPAEREILCTCSHRGFPEAPINTGFTGQSNWR